MSGNLYNQMFYRASVFVFSVTYSIMLLYIYIYYAAANWSQYGFYYGRIDFQEWLLLIFSLLCWALVVPTRINKPSCIFVIVTYLLIAIPAIVAAICYDHNNTKINLFLLGLVFAASFFIFSLVVRLQKWALNTEGERTMRKQYLLFIQGTWVFLLAVLLYNYWTIMDISSLDKIYSQRSLGAATNLYLGYAQTYFGYVFSPLLFSLGLYFRSSINVLLGCVGCLVLYSITAEKTIFLLPIFIYFFYRAIDSKRETYKLLSNYLVLLNAVLLLSITVFNGFSISEFILWYLGVRLILIPGNFIVIYSDFFYENGYTYLSHIRGLNMFIEAPSFYSSDDLWPSIGRLVGEYQIGIKTLNANANFIASDGIASFGFLGIPLFFSIFALFLLFVNRATKEVSLPLVVSSLFPLALNLINGSLFTLMTSFGGGIFIIIFLFFFKKCKVT